jgi:YfiH family protein
MVNTDWIRPDWPAPKGVHAVCTTRVGGHSAGPWESLNLGDHVGDSPSDIAANRKRLQSHLQAVTPGARAVFLKQVHGLGIARLSGASPDGLQADAAVANQAGLACTVMVADCLPVLLARKDAQAVAAAHAGWRGLAGMEPSQPGQGILECVLPALHGHTGPLTAQEADNTLVWLGPCIGPQAFEVGPEVRHAFCQYMPTAEACFVAKASGKWLADLPALARLRLAALGVKQVFGNDSSAPWCTVGNPARFFSYRRDQAALGGSGRLAACVWLG